MSTGEMLLYISIGGMVFSIAWLIIGMATSKKRHEKLIKRSVEKKFTKS
jgi:hypothetical protein